jgi:hypothetical protein
MNVTVKKDKINKKSGNCHQTFKIFKLQTSQPKHIFPKISSYSSWDLQALVYQKKRYKNIPYHACVLVPLRRRQGKYVLINTEY